MLCFYSVTFHDYANNYPLASEGGILVSRIGTSDASTAIKLAKAVFPKAKLLLCLQTTIAGRILGRRS